MGIISWFGSNLIVAVPLGVFVVAALLVLLKSIHIIGPDEVGLVEKLWGKSLPDGNPIAFHGEAGYQAKLLMPGLQLVPWPLYSVEKHPRVQIPVGQIGLVIAQVGKPIAPGAKSAAYKKEFGNFTDVTTFVQLGGEKGVQRPVLQPGTMEPIHPVAFLVITSEHTFGTPMSPDVEELLGQVKRDELVVTRIQPDEHGRDQCGIVTTLEGAPVDPGDIASRLGGFADIAQLEAQGGAAGSDMALVEAVLGNKNAVHNNYQDFQAFLDAGGRIGLQHDTLPYGAYNLNPMLVRVETRPMLTVEQGEVAVIKAYIGLPTVDTSGPDFKHGSLVRPGHRGLWQEPLRTGKYAINSRLYVAIMVPTAILTLNWADYNSAAHALDKELKPIDAKSREGFPFSIDLQVQLHVPDTKAPWVISRVGSMSNLVNELLQGAVGNHFRNTLQGMPAVSFIEQRQDVQSAAETHVKHLLGQYQVETTGVLIQDVKLPPELTVVLQEREIASQRVATFQKEEAAEEARKAVEAAKGVANMQASLVQARLGVDLELDKAKARKAEADGQAYYVSETGKAAAAATEAQGLALAKGYEAQVRALGPDGTTRVAVARELATGKHAIVPSVQGGGGSSLVEGLVGLSLLDHLPKTNNASTGPAAPSNPAA